MQTISLNGAWEFTQTTEENWLTAVVPGCVHTDLRTAGEIPDPYYRDNEDALYWIGESDWRYRRVFTVTADLLSESRVLLRCHGLDTLARIQINGRLVGNCDNQFRLWEFDVKEFLQSGDNEIEIVFGSAVAYGQGKLEERYIHGWGFGGDKIAGGNYLRKSPCNFGWDWGPKMVTCGIWQDIELVGLSHGRLADVHVIQDHHPDGSAVRVLAWATMENGAPDGNYRVEMVVRYEGEVVATAEGKFPSERAVLETEVANPVLWWPNGLGEQPLYDVTVTLFEEDNTIDDWSRRIGLRTLTLVTQPDEWGESFHFECNGVPFFSKGGNWIPADTFVSSISDEQYRDLLQSSADANMNMLRVWGGGIYEQDIFYEICDELGLCVWQDFIFACATYPSFDAAFMENVAQEARDNIQRIRHHACLALWCGNNELEQGLVDDEWTDTAMSWQDYARLFEQLLRDLVFEFDPQTSYWTGSPHSPYGNRLEFNNPNWGDAHIWDVWHGNQPFEFYRTCFHRFNSEFGFQSLPEPATLNTVLADEDKNLTSYVMEKHQRSPVGNTKIMSYMLEWFQLPSSFVNTVWLSQILQGMAIKYAVEHWRRTMPRGMGTLYWQVNDCWPVASWSSVDSYGRWKGLHYMAKHFFAPTLLSAVEDLPNGRVDLHITHDQPDEQRSDVLWQVVKASDGAVLQDGRFETAFSGPASQHVGQIDIADLMATHGERELLVTMQLVMSGETAATNLVHLSRPKHICLADPELSWQVRKDGSVATIEITAVKPALWVWLELDGSAHGFSDNFFHLFPQNGAKIRFETALTAVELMERLRVSSLWDTF